MFEFSKLFKKLTPKALYENFLKEDASFARPASDKEEDISIKFTGNFPLWEHQIDMLKRCLSIERHIDHKITVYPTNAITYMEGSKPRSFDCKIGIMNDPPGVGKTHVMLSLLQEDDSPSLNLVVCPPNIVHQWKEAIESYFSKGVFPYICVSEFHQTYINPDHLKDVRLIIVSSMLAERLSISDFQRVIVDEVDSQTGILHNIPKCDRVWFMSASFDPTDEKKRRIGAFNLAHLETKQIVEFVCRLLQMIQPILSDNAVKFTTTMEGSAVKNEAAIKRYHDDKECRAILINSMKDGCGLNLENTTHILFLHYTNPEMVEQVIGRAQRPGRTCCLHIVCLYYKNEIPKWD